MAACQTRLMLYGVCPNGYSARAVSSIDVSEYQQRIQADFYRIELFLFQYNCRKNKTISLHHSPCHKTNRYNQEPTRNQVPNGSGENCPVLVSVRQRKPTGYGRPLRQYFRIFLYCVGIEEGHGGDRQLDRPINSGQGEKGASCQPM